MFVVPLVFAWKAPYVTELMPILGRHSTTAAIITDAIFVVEPLRPRRRVLGQAPRAVRADGERRLSGARSARLSARSLVSTGAYRRYSAMIRSGTAW